MVDKSVKCVICGSSEPKLVWFTVRTLTTFQSILMQRKLHNLKYKDVVLPAEMYGHVYHTRCYKMFIGLKKKYNLPCPKETSDIENSIIKEDTSFGDTDYINTATLIPTAVLPREIESTNGSKKRKVKKTQNYDSNEKTEAAIQLQNKPLREYTEIDIQNNIPHVKPELHCRICTDKKHICSLLGIENIKQDFENLCNHFRIHLDWQHDSLPKKICVECFNTLKSAYDLISKLEDSQEILRQKYVQVKEEFSVVVKVENDVEVETQEEIVRPPPPTVFVVTETWKDYPWYCTHCGQRFEGMSSLRAHSQQTHAVCYAFHCVDCGGFCNSFDVFVEHVRTHRPALRRICQYCNQRFRSNEACLAHNAEHWEEPLCTQCGQICDDEETLEKHKSTEEYNAQWWSTPRLNTIGSKDSWKDYEWICRLCCEQKPDLGALRRHSLEAHGSCFSVKCMDCAQACDSFANFVEHVRVHRPYLRKYCQYCNVGHADSIDLQLHVANHLQGHHYCRVCEQIFHGEDALTAHVSSLRSSSRDH